MSRMLVVGKVVMISGALLVLAGWGWAQDRQIRRNPERATGAVSAESRLALVIGNSNYETGPLRNPANDAKAMTKTLRELGFEVIEKVNVTEKEMKQAIDDFGDRIENAAVRLFYYSGHGLQVEGHNYLVPIGAKIKSERDVDYDAINVGKVLARMESRDKRMNIVILDACRDNPYRRGFRSDTKGLAPLDAPTGTVVAYATGPGKVAADGPGNNGVYTTELIKWMQVPGLKIEDVFKRVRRSLSDSTGDRQVPWESVSLVGDFYFKPPVAGVRETATGEQIAGGPALPVEIPGPKQLKAGDTWKEPITGMEFVWVPGGCFLMGQSEGEKSQLIREVGEKSYQQDFSSEAPEHEVCVDGFWIGKKEVTRGQFSRFVNSTKYKTAAEIIGISYRWNGKESKQQKEVNWRNPGFDQTDDHPVVDVTWNDANAMAEWLSLQGRGKFRLPSEAEWEYACRAGTNTSRFWGDDGTKACRYANVADLAAKRQFTDWTVLDCDDRYVFTAPAASFLPNGFGIHDMLGNVWEWCEDVYSDKAYSKHQRNNPVYLEKDYINGKLRVVRGGGWIIYPREVRCANRGRDLAVHHMNDYLGFRLVRSP